MCEGEQGVKGERDRDSWRGQWCRVFGTIGQKHPDIFVHRNKPWLRQRVSGSVWKGEKSAGMQANRSGESDE